MAHYAKAIVAALVAGLSDEVLSTAEWLIALIAFLTALGAVWAVPNKPSA